MRQLVHAAAVRAPVVPRLLHAAASTAAGEAGASAAAFADASRAVACTVAGVEFPTVSTS